MTPMLVELSRRSGDADRGSAFSLFSAALAAALVIGSIGGAPIVATFGFEAALLVTLVGIAGAAAITLWDWACAPGQAGAAARRLNAAECAGRPVTVSPRSQRRRATGPPSAIDRSGTSRRDQAVQIESDLRRARLPGRPSR